MTINTYHSTLESTYAIPVEDYDSPSGLINGMFDRRTETLEVVIEHESEACKGFSFKWGDEVEPWYRVNTHLKTAVLHALNVLVTELIEECGYESFELEIYFQLEGMVLSTMDRKLTSG